MSLWDRLFRRQAPVTPGTTDNATTADKDVVLSRQMDNLELAERIYINNPPWLSEDKDNPLIGTNTGALVAAEIARMVTIESKIAVENNPDVDAVIQDYVMPNLRTELEKGWALGGIVFKPYFSGATMGVTAEGLVTSIDGKMRVAFVYPSQFLIDDYDNNGAIIQIRFFSTVMQQARFFTKVETMKYNELLNQVTITNEVFVTASAPTKYKWDDLGNTKVPLTDVKRWENIQPNMIITNVKSALVGMYKPPMANNLNFNSPYGISPLVRAAQALRRIDIVQNAIDWEVDSSLARLIVDERSIARTDRIPKKLAKVVTRLLGDETKRFFEKWSPEIRHESYLKLLNSNKCDAEDLIGVAHGTISEAPEMARTATEITKTRQRTFSTVVDNQKALEDAIRQLAYSISVWLNPTEASVEGEELEITFDWDDSVVANPTEQLTLYMILQNAGNIPKWKTNQMFFNMDEEAAKELIMEAQGGDGSVLSTMLDPNRPAPPRELE